MNSRLPQTITRLRPAARRRGAARSERVETTMPRASRAPEARVREAGGPEDVAVYTCGCGLLWTAAVSASVSCPHCGIDQAW